MRNGEATILDPSTQRMVEGFVYNQNGEVENIASPYPSVFGRSYEISNIRFTGKK